MMPAGALAAQHAAVDRVVAIALDVADAAVLQMNFDAAAAGAHVAGGVLDLVGHRGDVSMISRGLKYDADPLNEAALLRAFRSTGTKAQAAHALVLLVAMQRSRAVVLASDRSRARAVPPPGQRSGNYIDYLILQHRPSPPVLGANWLNLTVAHRNLTLWRFRLSRSVSARSSEYAFGLTLRVSLLRHLRLAGYPRLTTHKEGRLQLGAGLHCCVE